MDTMSRSIARVLAVSAAFFGVQAMAQDATTTASGQRRGDCAAPSCPHGVSSIDRAASGLTHVKESMR